MRATSCCQTCLSTMKLACLLSRGRGGESTYSCRMEVATAVFAVPEPIRRCVSTRDVGVKPLLRNSVNSRNVCDFHRESPQEVTMEILSTADVASVTLFTLKISESEIQAYESCIFYVLNHLTSKEIEAFTGHTRDELEDVHQELLAAILAHCSKQFLPERYKV